MVVLERLVGNPTDYASVDYRGREHRGVPIIAQPNNPGLEADCGVRACFMAIQSALNKFAMDNNEPNIILSFQDLMNRCHPGIPVKLIFDMLQTDGIVEEHHFVNGRRNPGCPFYKVQEYSWSFPAQYPESEAVVRMTLLNVGPAVVGVFPLRNDYDVNGQRLHKYPLYMLGDRLDRAAQPIVAPQPFVDHFGQYPLIVDPQGQRIPIPPGSTTFAQCETYHAILLVGSPPSPRSRADSDFNPTGLYAYKQTWSNTWGLYGNGCQELDIKLLKEAYCISSISKVTMVHNSYVDQPLIFP